MVNDLDAGAYKVLLKGEKEVKALAYTMIKERSKTMLWTKYLKSRYKNLIWEAPKKTSSLLILKFPNVNLGTLHWKRYYLWKRCGKVLEEILWEKLKFKLSYKLVHLLNI